MVGSRRQGWAIYAAMMTLFVVAVAVVYAAEVHADAGACDAAGVHGGNLEGKEQRFGIALLVAVRRGHDRRVVRRGQRGDGVAHRPRRRRSRWRT